MSKLVVDHKSAFYVWTTKKLDLYWEMQRNYIQLEVNRMRKASTVTLKKGNAVTHIKLNGYQMVNEGRVSTLSYHLFQQNASSIIYCLLSLGVISEEDCRNIFSNKNQEEAKEMVWEGYNKSIDYVKKALNLDSKFYGWAYGMHKHFYRMLSSFKGHFDEHVMAVRQAGEALAGKLEKEVKEKKVKDVYFPLYNEMAGLMKGGAMAK
jgi:hypothetical protein